MTEATAEDLPPLRLPQTLTDGVIVLDAHTLADAEAHWAGEDDEMRRRFDSRRRATLEEMRGAVQRWIDGRRAGRPEFPYALRLPSGVLMGGCATYLLAPDRANVSYWVYPAYRRQGYAARARALLGDAAASIDGLAQLEAHIDADNIASRRTAEALGYVLSGTIVDVAWDGEKSTRLRYVRSVRPA